MDPLIGSALISGGLGLIGNLFGKKKKTQYAAREDPAQQARRDAYWRMLSQMMQRGPMGMGPTMGGYNILSTMAQGQNPYQTPIDIPSILGQVGQTNYAGPSTRTVRGRTQPINRAMG